MLDPAMLKIHKNVDSDEVFVATWVRHWVEALILTLGYLSVAVGAMLLAGTLLERFASFLGRRFRKRHETRPVIDRD